MKSQVKVVPKGWGSEFIIANTERYCGKLLNFNSGAKFSLHYHVLKDETWYVAKGSFLLRWIDTESGSWHTDNLTVGDVVHVAPGRPHQLEALEESVVFEVSTQHFDNDSYRIASGDKL